MSGKIVLDAFWDLLDDPEADPMEPARKILELLPLPPKRNLSGPSARVELEERKDKPDQ